MSLLPPSSGRRVKSGAGETVEIKGKSPGKQTSAEPTGPDRPGEGQGAPCRFTHRPDDGRSTDH
jgi:hypothetical protein